MSRSKTLLVVGIVVILSVGGLLSIGLVTEGDVIGNEGDSGTTAGDEGHDDEEPTEDTDDSGGDDTKVDTEDKKQQDESEEDGTDESENEAEQDGSEEQEEETVEMPVEIYAADLGPVDEGEMYLVNQTNGETVATHNFSEGGHKRTFEGLADDGNYAIEVNVSFFPDERIEFSPRFTNGGINETIGYEFQGAETYVIEWEVDDIIDGTGNATDEDVKTLTIRGNSYLDSKGNYYTTWEHPIPDDSRDYFYFASNNKSYEDDTRQGADWKRTNGHWGEQSVARDVAVQEGLSGVEEREFIKEKEVISLERDIVHVYELSKSVFDDPITVEIDPKTGYVTKTDARIEERDESESTRSESEAHSHDEEIDAIPDNFPIEEFEKDEN